jgi:hypothetical protein
MLKPWWKVELPAKAMITTVRIRGRNADYYRLHYADIEVDSVICNDFGHTGWSHGYDRYIDCGETGTEIKIQSERHDHMQLCEVEAWGHFVETGVQPCLVPAACQAKIQTTIKDTRQTDQTLSCDNAWLGAMHAFNGIKSRQVYDWVGNPSSDVADCPYGIETLIEASMGRCATDIIEIDSSDTCRSDLFTGTDKYWKKWTVMPLSQDSTFCANGRNAQKSECLSAAKRAINFMSNGTIEMGRDSLQIESASYIPPGCSINTGGDYAATWNVLTTGTNQGDYTPICSASKYYFIMSDAKCNVTLREFALCNATDWVCKHKTGVDACWQSCEDHFSDGCRGFSYNPGTWKNQSNYCALCYDPRHKGASNFGGTPWRTYTLGVVFDPSMVKEWIRVQTNALEIAEDNNVVYGRTEPYVAEEKSSSEGNLAYGTTAVELEISTEESAAEAPLPNLMSEAHASALEQESLFEEEWGIIAEVQAPVETAHYYFVAGVDMNTVEGEIATESMEADDLISSGTSDGFRFEFATASNEAINVGDTVMIAVVGDYAGLQGSVTEVGDNGKYKVYVDYPPDGKPNSVGGLKRDDLRLVGEVPGSGEEEEDFTTDEVEMVDHTIEDEEEAPEAHDDISGTDGDGEDPGADAGQGDAVSFAENGVHDVATRKQRANTRRNARTRRSRLRRARSHRNTTSTTPTSVSDSNETEELHPLVEEANDARENFEGVAMEAIMDVVTAITQYAKDAAVSNERYFESGFGAIPGLAPDADNMDDMLARMEAAWENKQGPGTTTINSTLMRKAIEKKTAQRKKKLLSQVAPWPPSKFTAATEEDERTRGAQSVLDTEIPSEVEKLESAFNIAEDFVPTKSAEQNAKIAVEKDSFSTKLNTAKASLSNYTIDLEAIMKPMFKATEGSVLDEASSTADDLDWSVEKHEEQFDNEEQVFQGKQEISETDLRQATEVAGTAIRSTQTAGRNLTDAGKYIGRTLSSLEKQMRKTIGTEVEYGLKMMDEAFSKMEKESDMNGRSASFYLDPNALTLTEDEAATLGELRDHWILRLKPGFQDRIGAMSDRVGQAVTDTTTTEDLVKGLNREIETIAGFAEVAAKSEKRAEKASKSVSRRISELALDKGTGVQEKEMTNTKSFTGIGKTLMDGIEKKRSAALKEIFSTSNEIDYNTTMITSSKTDEAMQFLSGMSNALADLRIANERYYVDEMKLAAFPKAVAHSTQEIVQGGEQDELETVTLSDDAALELDQDFEAFHTEIFDYFDNQLDRMGKDFNRTNKKMNDTLHESSANVGDLAAKFSSTQAKIWKGQTGLDKAHAALHKIVALLKADGAETMAEQKGASKAIETETTDTTKHVFSDFDYLVSSGKGKGKNSMEQQDAAFNALAFLFQKMVNKDIEAMTVGQNKTEEEYRFAENHYLNSTAIGVLAAINAAGAAMKQLAEAGVVSHGPYAKPLDGARAAKEALYKSLTNLLSGRENLKTASRNAEYVVKRLIANMKAGAAMTNLVGGFQSEVQQRAEALAAEQQALEGGAKTAFGKMQSAEGSQTDQIATATRQFASMGVTLSGAIGEQIHTSIDGTKAKSSALRRKQFEADAEGKRIAGEIYNVFSDISKESGHMGNTLSEVEDASVGEIESVSDTSTMTAKEAEHIQQLQTDADHTMELKQSIGEAAARAVQLLMTAVNFDLGQIADHQIKPQMSLVNTGRKGLSDGSEELESLMSDGTLDVQREIAVLRDNQQGLVQHVESRQRSILQDIGGLQAQIESMSQSMPHFDASAFSAVLGVLETTMANDDDLRQSVDTQIAPQMETWRQGIGQVLNSLGEGLDMEQITAAAQDAYEREHANRQLVAQAEGQVNSYLRNAERLAEHNIREQREKLDAEVRAVLQDAELSTTEKMSKIRELKEAALRTERLTSEKARLLVASQQASALSLEEQRKLLTDLVARAQERMDMPSAPLPHGDLAILRDNLQSDMDQAGKGFRTASLIQLSTEHDKVLTAMADVAAGTIPSSAPFHAVVDARLVENSGWLDELNRLSNSTLT